ncbi:hypothetical protein H8D36_06485 [archaeon]|nr:hypothetical protein [archaeon]MBL7056969.1 hypothetical protein [Candidatus Woesearchaeota archaeon]
MITGTAKRQKHDKYQDYLYERIKHSYNEILTNIPLYSQKKGRRIAEIDILAFHNDGCDIYEVKCSYRPVKAKKQLTKIKRLVPNVKNTFFFCGESGVLESV